MGKTETERKCAQERCWWKQNGGNINWSPSSCVEGYGDDSPGQVPCPLWLWAWNNATHCGLATSPFSHHVPQPPIPLARSISHKHSFYRYECTLINHKSRQRDTLNHHICPVILLFGRWGGSELEMSKLNENTSRWVSLFDTGASYNPESTRLALNNIHRGKEKTNYFIPQKYNTPELLAYISALFCFETLIQSHNLLVMLTIKHVVHTVLL